MRVSLSEVLQHVRDNKRRWALFVLALALLSGWAVRHEQGRSRLEAMARAGAVERLDAFFTAGDTGNSAKRGLDSLEVTFVALDSTGRPILWRGVCRTRLLGLCRTPLRASDPSYAVEEALVQAVARLSTGQPPLLLMLGRSNIPIRVYYGFPSWYDGPGLALPLGILLLLFLTGIFYSGVKDRDLAHQARLWVNFAKETAHQLGTPLSSLYGWIEMLKMKLVEGPGPVDDKIKHVLDEAADDLRKLSQRVFRFSQIGSIPEMVESDLNGLVRETVGWFRERLPRADRTIQIVANYDDEVPPLLLNRDLMGWVLENLLKNAMDAIHKQEGIIQLETRYLPKENRIRITHTDNGSGIKRENVRRIFLPGFSTKKHGWGLGLALARRIVEDYHAGRIFVESTQLDRGTTFVVDLPVRRAVPAVAKEPAAHA